MAKVPFEVFRLDFLIKDGYVTKRKHPEFDLWVLNYTDKCTFERKWNSVTEACRGLIVDADWNVVSRPFKKFFTLNEWTETFKREVPDEDFKVYVKLDGSLGITFVGPDGKMRISTRGSFESPQAIRGTQLFKEQFCCTHLDPSITYLFEIICAESRYVVDYGEWEGLVLIGAIDTESGQELALSDYRFTGWKKAEQYTFADDLKAWQEIVNQSKNTEGVVVRFESGLRLKIKSEEYTRLFKILVGLNRRSVWEYLKSGGTINELKNGLPSHTQQFIDEASTKLHQNYEDIYGVCFETVEYWNSTNHWPHARKKFAQWATGQPFAAVLFAMYDQDWKKADEIVWKLIKPGVEDG